MRTCQLHPSLSLKLQFTIVVFLWSLESSIFKMVEINCLKVMSVIKKVFEATLFVAFLYMTVKAMSNLFSFKTTLNISREHRNITNLPAFSVCKNWQSIVGGFDKEELANGSMGKGLEHPFPVRFRLQLGLEDGDTKSMDLKNETAIRNFLDFGQLEEMWSLQSKPFAKWYSDCMPCITFNGAHFKQLSSPVTFASVNSIFKIDLCLVLITFLPIFFSYRS